MKSRGIIIVILLLNTVIARAGTSNSDSLKKVSWAAVPAPSFNDVQGFGLAVTGGAFYSLNSSDTSLSPSATLVYGFYAENRTWIGALLQEAYFSQDNYWFTFLYATGDFVFRYYPGAGPKDLDLWLDYNTLFHMLDLDFKRKIRENLYVGMAYQFTSYNSSFRLSPNDEISIPVHSNENKYSGIGLIASNDSRDHKLNPRSGLYSNVKMYWFENAWGSDKDFRVLEFDLNYYRSLSSNMIWANRFYSYISWKDVPFEMEGILGYAGSRGNDTRGYSTGRYRGKQLYDLQSELRWRFYKAWGMVAFGSVALVGDDAEEIGLNGILPAVGLGLRYNAAADRDVNIGIDFAKGKEDYGIYFILTEVF
jgi:outer membrane protein assembly factor BamA